MGDPPALKRPKLEKDDYESAYWPRPAASNASSASKPPQSSSSATATAATQEDEEDDIAEEAVLALIAHRERDVERCKLKLSHYQSLVPPPFPLLFCLINVAILIDSHGSRYAAVAGHRGEEARRGARSARPVSRSQAASAADP